MAKPLAYLIIYMLCIGHYDEPFHLNGIADDLHGVNEQVVHRGQVLHLDTTNQELAQRTCESLSVKLAADKETAERAGKYDSRIRDLKMEYDELFRKINSDYEEE